jgi:predicted transcriptional regulator
MNKHLEAKSYLDTPMSQLAARKRQRLALEMRSQGMLVREIANLLDVTKPAVSAYLRRPLPAADEAA